MKNISKYYGYFLKAALAGYLICVIMYLLGNKVIALSAFKIISIALIVAVVITALVSVVQTAKDIKNQGD